MKQNHSFARLGHSLKMTLSALLSLAALAWSSTASAVIVDGIFDANDNYQNVTSLSFRLDNGTMVQEPGTLAWSVGANGNVFVAFVQPLSINDNTYGTNAIGWGSKAHKFNDLVGSDKSHFDLFNGAGQAVISFDLDYITAKSGTPSGFASLGVLGGDGKMTGLYDPVTGKYGSTTLGSAASILHWGTSLDHNLNTISSQFLTNSPSAAPQLNPDGSIDYSRPYLNSAAPGWVYNISYEVEISAAAFGASGFGSVIVPFAHDSPSKFGQNTIIVVPEPATYFGGLALIGLLLAAHARAVRKKARA